jgi:hypothetical protein
MSKYAVYVAEPPRKSDIRSIISIFIKKTKLTKVCNFILYIDKSTVLLFKVNLHNLKGDVSLQAILYNTELVHKQRKPV